MSSSTTTVTLHPTIKWAQRKDKIYITLEVRDIENQKVDLKEDMMKFQCGSTGGKNRYQFVVNFYEGIVVEESKWAKTGFHMIFVLVKKDQNKGFWPRLTKQGKKTQYIQIDWDKWVDQDEEQESGSKGLGGMDYEGMNNFNDSDDQEEDKKEEAAEEKGIDDLEKEEDIVEGEKKEK